MLKISSLIITLVWGFNYSMAADAKKGQALFETCIQCHGDQGMGLQEKNAPMIAGQYDWYIEAQLKAFKSKERENPEMYPFISNLSSTDYADLAAYISKMRVPTPRE